MNRHAEMTKKYGGSGYSVRRSILAFCVVPLAVASLYTAMQVGWGDFFPFVFIAFTIAYVFTFLLFIPLYLYLSRTGNNRIGHLLIFTCAVGFAAFFALYWLLAGQFEQYEQNGMPLIVNGAFTRHGLVEAFSSSLVGAAFVGLGVSLFWLIARRW